MKSEIPIIDLGRISADLYKGKSSDWCEIGDQIRSALHEVGFMYLTNHGIPDKIIADFFAISEQFFLLPDELKRKYKKNLKESRNGWVQPGEELLHPESKFEYRECFDITTQKKFYPTDVPSFRSTHIELESNCQKLIKTLLKLLAISLKLPDPDYFINSCCHLAEPEVANECEFSMIYYPPITSDTVLPPDTVRCAEHTDYEIITLLFQNQVGGLEIKTTTGDWLSADPIPNSILVNTGDLLEMWTNKYYPATIHRVVIPKTDEERKKARFTFAYFIAPDSQTVIKPLDSPLIPKVVTGDGQSRDNEQSTKFNTSPSPVTAYEHIMGKVKTAYGVAVNK